MASGIHCGSPWIRETAVLLGEWVGTASTSGVNKVMSESPADHDPSAGPRNSVRPVEATLLCAAWECVQVLLLLWLRRWDLKEVESSETCLQHGNALEGHHGTSGPPSSTACHCHNMLPVLQHWGQSVICQNLQNQEPNQCYFLWSWLHRVFVIWMGHWLIQEVAACEDFVWLEWITLGELLTGCWEAQRRNQNDSWFSNGSPKLSTKG